MIKALKPLVMMQLKDKLDLGYLKNKKEAITKIVLSIVAFVVITAVIYVLFTLSKMFNIFHLISIIPVSVIVVIFTVMEILALLSCIFGLMKTLFFSKDNPVLLTLPVTTNQVFISKLIVYFIYELKKTLYFIVPLFLAYGLATPGLPIYFYLWIVVCWLLISVLNISIASLFSIFAMWLTMFLRNFSLIRITLFLGIVGVAIWLVVSLINLIPANIDLTASWGVIFRGIQDFLKAFTRIMVPFTMLTELIVGGYLGLRPRLFNSNTLPYLGMLLGVIVVFLALSFLISRPLFFKMAAKPFEYRKVTREFKRKNRKTNSFLSAVKSQTLLISRTSDELFPLMGCAIALPILVLLLNKIFAAISTRALGDFMTIAFNMLIILLVSLATNSKIASIYSREGAAAYLNKTRPNEYRTNLIAKLMPNAIVMVTSIIVASCVFADFAVLNTISKICFALTAIFAYLMHLLWSAEMDIMNPQTNHYATTGDHANNPNETKSSVTMFIVSFLTCGIGLFLSMENLKVSWVKISILFAALLVYRIWSYLSSIKYFYKEK